MMCTEHLRKIEKLSYKNHKPPPIWTICRMSKLKRGCFCIFEIDGTPVGGERADQTTEVFSCEGNPFELTVHGIRSWVVLCAAWIGWYPMFEDDRLYFDDTSTQYVSREKLLERGKTWKNFIAHIKLRTFSYEEKEAIDKGNIRLAV